MQVIRRDESTGAPTILFRVHVDRGISWDMAQGFLQQALAPVPPTAALAAPAASGAEAGSEADTEGHAQASPSTSPGDQDKSKQKLKVRLGGKLVTSDNGKTSSGRTAKGTNHEAPPANSPAAGHTTSSSLPEDDAEMHVSPASDLLLLQDMERQSRLDSLDTDAETAADHTGRASQPFTVAQQPSQDGLSNTDQASVAAAGATRSQHDPSSDSAHKELDPYSFHSSLGTGSALGALLADAPKAEPRISPQAEGGVGPLPSVSGYYRPERGAVRGLLLALETQGKGQVAVYRPATGPAARPMRINELQEK